MLIRNKCVQGILVLCATSVIALAAQTPAWALTFKTMHSSMARMATALTG
jgi:hypothetical protein